MSDHEIVELFLSRDERAVAEAKTKYGARLRAIAYGVLGDAHAAEDATDSFSTHIVFQLNIVSRFCGKLGASEGPLPSVRLIVSGLPRAVC